MVCLWLSSMGSCPGLPVGFEDRVAGALTLAPATPMAPSSRLAWRMALKPHALSVTLNLFGAYAAVRKAPYQCRRPAITAPTP